MANFSVGERSKNCSQGSLRRRNTILFVLVALFWLLCDVITKSFINSHYAVGEKISEPIGGLFQLRLVHNTGAAWGMFNESTFILAILALVVCLVLIGYFIFLSPRASKLEVLGLALVCAGGLGNAIDRFFLGYVVDFIEFTFIDFPVFNIADMGVTCGFVIVISGMFFAGRVSKGKSKESHASFDVVEDAKQESK